MEFLILILGCALNAFIARGFGEIAADKGYEQKKYFWYCFWLPVAGYLMVAALPDRGQPADRPRARIPDISYDELPQL